MINDRTAEFNLMPKTGWFPGHMLKAGRKIKENLKLIDLVVEIIDARIPISSINPNFKGLLSGKPTFMLLNKCDLADPKITAQWEHWFQDNNYFVATVDAKSGKHVSKLIGKWKQAIDVSRKRSGAKYALMHNPRVMIIGIPNVGKSTLVNRLATTKRAAVGPKPGVTRNNQWLKLKGQIELLDTPGVLWPTITNKCHELKLALTNTMNDKIVGEELVADYLLWHMQQQTTAINWKLYDITTPPDDISTLLELICRKRGLLLPGGKHDTQRAAFFLLKDFRDGRLGKISLEIPE